MQDLQTHLGPARLSKKKNNAIYTWDQLGLIAYSNDDKFAQSLLIQLVAEKYDFSPKANFNGKLSFYGEDGFSYYPKNKDKLEKLFLSDDSGAFVFNDISAWFSLDEKDEKQVLSAIQISPYVEPDFKNPKIKVAVDSDYAHFEKLWLDWIQAIESVVPRNNRYFNLISGITNEAIQSAEKNKDIQIPKALVNFYKVRDVDYDGVTSAFNFNVEGAEYDLLPFKDIITRWSEIQDLQSDDEGEDEYANPKWIPFAENHEGDYLLFDSNTEPKGKYGQIIELQNESWKRDIVADSLESIIRKEIQSINDGNIQRFDFILGKD